MPNEDLKKLDELGKVVTEYNIDAKLRKKYSKIITAKHQSKPVKNKLFIINNILKIASILIVFLISVLVFKNSVNEYSIQELAKSYVDNTVVMGDSESIRGESVIQTELRKKLSESHATRDYNTLISIYNKIQLEEELSNVDQYYLGVSYLKTYNYQEAIHVLTELNQKDHILSEEVNWLLSLAYILTDQVSVSKNTLQKNIESKAYKYKESQQLLNAISKE